MKVGALLFLAGFLVRSRCARLERAEASVAGTVLQGRFRLLELLSSQQSGVVLPSTRNFPWPDSESYSSPERLGRGASGITWKAHDLHRNTDVAIKFFVMGGSYITRRHFRYRKLAEEGDRECTMIQNITAGASSYTLGRSHICRCLESHVLDMTSDDQPAFLVMEYCGTSMRVAVKKDRHNPQLILRARRWLRDCVMAIRFMHGLSPSVSHNDLHWDNIVLSDADEAKLIDFGLAKRENPGSTRKDVTALGKIFYAILCDSFVYLPGETCPDGTLGIGAPADFKVVQSADNAVEPELLMSMLPPPDDP